MFARGQTDTAGVFAIADLLPANDYQLSVHSLGDYRQYDRQNLTIGDDSEPLVIRSLRHEYGSFEGKVVDSNGMRVAGLSLWVKTHGIAGRTVVNTDADGRFTMQRLAAGRIQLYTSDEPRIRVGDIDLLAGQFVTHELVVDIGDQWLYGTVTDLSGERLAGARVTLQYNRTDSSTGSGRQTATNIDGHFKFTALGNGVRTLMVSAPGFAAEQLSVNPAEMAGPHWVTLTPAENL
ncbi:MAG: carboxypeptidase-like regulatory domain-containing protein [Pseudomonadota bacterium]